MTIHTLPRLPMSDIDRRVILTMWANKRMDTIDIAESLKLTEAQVYNVIARASAQKQPVNNRVVSLRLGRRCEEAVE